jgi:uncharacterized protein YciI
VGALVVLLAESLEAARALVRQDPFVTGGVFASLEVQPFRCAYPKRPAG